MIAKLLGLIDLFAIAMLLLIAFGIKIPSLIAIAIVLLLLKSLPFLFTSFCLACLIDIFTAIVLGIYNFFSIPLWLLFLALIAIGQKAFFSFI